MRPRFGLQGSVIEFAHRTGAPRGDGPRQIIAKWYSRQQRLTVMSFARERPGNTGYRLMNDFTQADICEKSRANP